MEAPHSTHTTEGVVHVPVAPEREALRQAVMKSPEFDNWLRYIRNERRELVASISANDASNTMSDYIEFIELEHMTLSQATDTITIRQHQDTDQDPALAFNPS